MRVLILLSCLLALNAADRINHAGRILPDTPVVTTPTLFNTPEADAVMATLQLMPADYAGNEDISDYPLLPNSNAMIAQIEAGFDTRWGTGTAWRYDLRGFFEMNWVLIPDNQPLQDIELIWYPDESDEVIDPQNGIARYPIPDNMPIETWPINTGGLSLYDWQRDINGDDGDRHSIVLQPGTGDYWETWTCKRLAPSSDPEWQAANLAKWNINSRALRPLGWTSADAAGLPMLPHVVRYDEVQRGEIEHAIRMIVYRTRKAYLYPATHYASVPETFDPDIPAMGERLRLKASFVIPPNWSEEAKCVARAFKRYGGIVADNGSFMSFSIAPDDRWPAGCFDDLRDIKVSDFEVVDAFGETEGPRAANPPTVDAGSDRAVSMQQGADLNAIVGGGSGPLSYSWYVYPHVTQPGTVTFSDDTATSTTASFSAPGDYIIMFTADDGSHTPVYDAVYLHVVDGPVRDVDLSWAAPGATFDVLVDDVLHSTVSTPSVTINDLDGSQDHSFAVVTVAGGNG